MPQHGVGSVLRKSNRYDVVSDPLKSHHTRQTDIAEVI